MCGIAGVYDSREPPTEATLEAMGGELAHRGPDGSGTYRDGSVGFAHRRLAIIDPDSRDQPFSNEDGSVVVAFNGELYNYRQLREDLVDDHRFETATDTEVLVHLYEECGVEMLEEIEGMYALAVWDRSAERLLLARDRIGIKPLLLARDGERLAFASEMPSLLAAAERDAVTLGDLDATAFAHYFAFGHFPAPRTAFENVRRLRPGERVFVTGEGLDRERFWHPSVTPQDPGLTEAATGLREKMEDSVERRLMSDVPLGAFLSGGIDSSIVVGTMADLMDDPVRTFTVGFEQSLFDESWAAREVADYHGTDHTEFTVTPDEVRDAIPTVLDRIGEPFADQSLIPTYIVSQETSRDVKVALSGDGADELFAGYSKYRGEYYSKYYRRLPEKLRSELIAPAVNSLNASRSGRRGELVRKAQKFLRGDVAGIADRHFAWNRILEDDTHTAFDGIDPSSVGRKRMREEHAHAAGILPGNRYDDISRILAVDTRFGLPNQILHKTDLASMYNSLEVRVPFLDTAVVEYAMSLPSEYKITRSEQKRVLKEAFEDRLPESILERDKQGFDMPIGEWFKNELATEFRGTVTGLDTDFVDTEEVLDVFEDHRTGRGEHGKFLWSVYVFARWHRQMVDAGVLSSEK